MKQESTRGAAASVLKKTLSRSYPNMLQYMRSMATVSTKIDLLGDRKEFVELFIVPQPQELTLSVDDVKVLLCCAIASPMLASVTIPLLPILLKVFPGKPWE